MPVPPESDAAREGTAAHECLEFILRNAGPGWCKVDAAATVALKKWPSQMVEAVLIAVSYIHDLTIGLDEQGIRYTAMIETKVDASPFTCEGQFGTLDFAAVVECGRLHVIDYKHGAGVVVEVRDTKGQLNPQLAYYALAISHQFEHWFSDVEITIIQPRAPHADGPIRSTVASMDELLSWGDTFRTGVERTRADDAALASGKWCKFCAASAVCPELRTAAMREAQAVFDDEKGLVKTSLGHLFAGNEKRLAQYLDAADKLEIWITAVRNAAFFDAERGAKIPGWKLVERRARRKWKEAGYAFETEAEKRFGSNAFEFPKMKSPAQLTKHVKNEDDLLWIEKNTVRESAGRKLVREGDSRDGVTGGRNAADVFDDLDDAAIIDAEWE